MPWRAYYALDTGRLVSEGSVWPETTPEGLAFKEYPALPDIDRQMWSEHVRDYVPRPDKVVIDRISDALIDPRFADLQDVWGILDQPDRRRLRAALERLLGRHRWRAQGEELVLR